MTLGEFKTRYLRSKINPILFYLPVKKKSAEALKYKVVASEVTVTMDTTYTSCALNDEQHLIITTYNVNSEISCVIDWGDGNYTTVYCKDKIGYYQENEEEKQTFSNPYNVPLNHSYSDGIYEHIISISGFCSKLHLGKYPVEIIQWGNLKMKSIDNFIYGRDNSFPYLTIPDTPMTGCEDITYINGLFNDCSLQEIPNNFFKNFKNLIWAQYVIAYTDVRKLGDGIFKNLKKISYINSIIRANDLLEEIGNDLFMNCSSIGKYRAWSNEPAIIAGGWTNCINGNARLKKVGDNLFKDCTGIQFLLSMEEVPPGDSYGYGSEILFRRIFPEGCKVQLGKSTFENCTELKDANSLFASSSVIYFEDTFKGCEKLVSLNGCFQAMNTVFRCKEGLFNNLQNLKYLRGTFYFTAIDSIPKFPDSPLVDIGCCFMYCQSSYHFPKEACADNFPISLPHLDGNHFYTGTYSGNFRFVTEDNLEDYIEIWSVKPLNCTGIITNKSRIQNAWQAFYSWTTLSKIDESIEPPAAEQLNYNSTWYGDMYPFWLDIENPDIHNLGNALVGCQRISNFNSITVDFQNLTHILEYTKYNEYLSWSNVAFARFRGDRDITEWTDD